MFAILITTLGCHTQKKYYTSLRHYKRQFKKNKTDIGFVLTRFSTDEEFKLLIAEIEKIGATLSKNVEPRLNCVYFKNKKLATKENSDQLVLLLQSKSIVNHVGGVLKDKKGKTYLVLTNRIILKLNDKKATKEKLDKIFKAYQLKKVRHLGDSTYVYKMEEGEIYDIVKAAIELHRSGLFEEVELDGFSALPDFDI